MSDKRRRPRICGICARIDMDDIDRKYCPIAAERIYYNKPADRCSFFAEDEERGHSGRQRRR